MAQQGGGIDAPHAGKARIGQPQPPVAAEHHDALGEVVERFTLHPHQRAVLGFQLQRLRHILIDIGDTALRVRIGDDAQGLAIGQVQPVLAGFQCRVARQHVALPAAPVGLFRQTAGGAQLVENGGVVGLAFEEDRVETPESAVGGIVELQLLVGAEYGHRRGELVKGAGVEIHRAPEFGLNPVEIRHIDGKPGGAIGRAGLDDIKRAALAGHDDGQPFGLRHRARPALSSAWRPARSSNSAPCVTAVPASGRSTARA